MLKKQEVIFMQQLERKYEEYQNGINLLKIEINVLIEKLKLKEREIQEVIIRTTEMSTTIVSLREKISSLTIEIQTFKNKILELELRIKNQKCETKIVEKIVYEEKIVEVEKIKIEYRDRIVERDA